MKTRTSTAANTKRVRTLYENTPEIILYQNSESTILDANPAFLHLVCEPRENVINHNFHEFLPERVHSFFGEKLNEALAGKTVRFEMYFAYKNSVPMHWDVVKIPLLKNKKVLGVHMIARDITEKVETQARIFQQNKDLQQFTYMVAHNLRSPLSNAIGLVDVLGTIEADTAMFKDIYAHAKNSLQQLDQVMKDMNMILSVRDKEGLSKHENVLLSEVVSEVIQNLLDDIIRCSGAVQVSIPDGFMIKTNKAYLYSIFFNLLSNAIKYREEQRPLLIELIATEACIQERSITISDNGLGIDLEKAGENMFKLYKRFHPQHSGRGLGLYLVKTHIESMGGHINVSSRPNHGTTFTITL